MLLSHATWQMVCIPPSICFTPSFCHYLSIPIISDLFLQNHSSYWFYIGSLNSPEWPSDLLPNQQAIFHQMLASDLLIGLHSSSPQRRILLLSYSDCELSHAVTVQSLSAPSNKIPHLVWKILSLDACLFLTLYLFKLVLANWKWRLFKLVQACWNASCS